MLCNYCHMKAIMRTAERAGLVVKVEPDTLTLEPSKTKLVEFGRRYFVSGVRVSVGSLSDKPEDYDFAAWFAALPEKCTC